MSNENFDLVIVLLKNLTSMQKSPALLRDFKAVKNTGKKPNPIIEALKSLDSIKDV
jgi:hypothetical protein